MRFSLRARVMIRVRVNLRFVVKGLWLGIVLRFALELVVELG